MNATLIPSKGFEVSAKMGRNSEKRAQSPSYTSPHLQFFRIIHCYLNGAKAAVEGLMLFLFSGFLQGAAITRKIDLFMLQFYLFPTKLL